jgi:hypothetical protein
MFPMRYCKSCLEPYRAELDNTPPDKYLVLQVPVEDDFGFLFKAYLAIMAGDFLSLLEGKEPIVDLAQHAQLLRLEDTRRYVPALH